jgi:hypothetical protein
VSGQERPGRYERSFGGLVGAVIVTVLVVVGFVVYTGIFRNAEETQRTPVDYVESVKGLQQSGVEVVYPATVPEGWTVVGVDVPPVDLGQAPTIGLDLTTSSEDYVGFDVVADDADDALEEVYDNGETITESDPLTGSPGVVADWQGWTVGDRDHAYTATYEQRTLVVFGSADPDELADLVGRLTVEPLPGVTPAPAPSSPAS